MKYKLHEAKARFEILQRTTKGGIFLRFYRISKELGIPYYKVLWSLIKEALTQKNKWNKKPNRTYGNVD